ncbi:cytochrome P450 [Mycena leptocephala]|nr:cytochrome P450 [Mycena leptocephala]
MTPVRQLGVSGVLILAAGFWLVVKVSFIFGLNRRIARAPDSGIVYQEWAAKYGPVFQIPTAFLSRRLILCDPKAVNHFYSMERSIYVKPKLGRAVLANLFGRGLFWAEGEGHKRQRKALTPAFSNAAIRRLTGVFYDSAYKLKTHWDTSIDNAPADGVIIDVEQLDSIGIAGFSHDFRTLDGEYSAVAVAFDSLNFEGQGIVSNLVFLLGTQFPFLAHLPLDRNRIMGNFRRTMSGIADDLLEKTRREKKSHISDETFERSIIGLLLKAEEEDAELRMDQTEVLAQVCIFLSLSLKSTADIDNAEDLQWALIELARKLEKQAKLREELAQFGTTDPTWDQLGSVLPYLDSVVLEILRLHPATDATTRQASVDDVLPVSGPITTASGEVVDSIAVAKGTIATVSICCMNQSEVFWGPNAKEFEPERWLTLSDEPLRAKEIQGHRHLVTFLDGPRTCLGKSFALAEFKAVLWVLINNFSWDFPGGPETEIATHRGLLQRPKVAGQPGANVPMRVRRAE